MTTPVKRSHVGELRPSQLLFSFGIGSIIDLPRLSVMAMGLDQWDEARCVEIGEDRLRAAVQAELGPQVSRLLAPPVVLESGNGIQSGGNPSQLIGVPVATFPRWMICPSCRLLAPLNSGLFELKHNPYRSEQTRYVHQNCNKVKTPPEVIPARFLLACPRGHLDDFPWMYFVHRGETTCRGPLQLREMGVSGEAADIRIDCLGCKLWRSMGEAFGEDAEKSLPACTGRRPHLLDYDEVECEAQPKTILMGASNSWFPVALSALSIPTAPDTLGQLVETNWHILEKVQNNEGLILLRSVGVLTMFSGYTDDAIMDAIQQKRSGVRDAGNPKPLKVPEWQVFTNPGTAPAHADFRVRAEVVPSRFTKLIDHVLLVERLREVRALIGFTRIESPGEFGEIEAFPPDRRAPLTRHSPKWVPAGEVRGEGIFIQFNGQAVRNWESSTKAILERDQLFQNAYRRWRQIRHLDPYAGYPSLRYYLLHSFSHALMRQLALECGYSAASIRERIYSLPPEQDFGPMAGVLIYTAASDSEGTLGGLVSLGEQHELGRMIDAALEQMKLCASDPLCAEHMPTESALLHGAACHACMFVPETSCERGNKYLDRTLLVPTVDREDLAFFNR